MLWVEPEWNRQFNGIFELKKQRDQSKGIDPAFSYPYWCGLMLPRLIFAVEHIQTLGG